MEAYKLKEIKRDVISSHNTICVTFQLYDNKYGFCATNSLESMELPVLLVFSDKAEALQFHHKMVDNLVNNRFAKKASSVKVMSMEEEYGVI